MSGILQLGNVTLGTENSGKVDLTNVGTTSAVSVALTEMNLSSTNHTWTVKAIDEAIVGATNNTKNDANSGQLAIYNGSTKLWGITEHGYVIKPKIPAFKVRKSASITTTGYVIFDTAIFNQENFYNNTTGRATAPVSGLYFLLVKINHYNRIDIEIRINETGGSETGYNYVEIGQYSTSNTGAGWYSSVLVTEAQMSAGDFASVNISQLQNNTDPNMWTHFSGYLIG